MKKQFLILFTIVLLIVPMSTFGQKAVRVKFAKGATKVFKCMGGFLRAFYRVVNDDVRTFVSGKINGFRAGFQATNRCFARPFKNLHRSIRRLYGNRFRDFINCFDASDDRVFDFGSRQTAARAEYRKQTDK